MGLQTLEEYSVVNDFDTNYIWSVSGDNEINYSGNKATISWNTPGTYQLMVTPYNDCGNGSAREITVIVEESNISPVIEGDEEVEEFSIHNEYFTSINAYSRYNWFVNGHQNFSANNNIITIDWGESGLGKIKLIETNVNSGTRKEAFLNVNINPVPIPSDNFNIEVISETCPNKNNGKIIISANETYNYVAIINGVEYNFTNDLTIEDLAPDIYELCITIPPGSYEQCYFIELPEGVSISGRSSEESGRVSINIDKGTAPYKVLVNGKLVLQTFSTSFSIDVQHGDSVEVKTDKACEGSFSKMIDLVDEVIAYPNPTTGDFEIAIPINLENITIDLYTIHSQLISSTSYSVVNGKIQLSLKEKPTGLYLIRIYLDNPVMLKLIKN